MKPVFENILYDETANIIAKLHAELVIKKLETMKFTQAEKIQILEAILNSEL